MDRDKVPLRRYMGWSPDPIYKLKLDKVAAASHVESYGEASEDCTALAHNFAYGIHVLVHPFFLYVLLLP